ncbi:hypothetical protein I2I05_00355 [Hymenobacter sp. BT683]|uniref:DUF3863 domain-containing protein n=1 Tax=Hymenobacter jeongseonensis TaxID=2791027 RepID=A0ABS0IDA4_9BACT|nr:hypothetical protein [Hymenobacter jeongseonensis]MBF9235835.1 hypothetical protein [Hymenobacter jeongseonensis]
MPCLLHFYSRPLWHYWALLLGLSRGLSVPAAAQPVAGTGPPRVVLSDSLVRHFLSRSITVQGIHGLPPAERQAFAAWAGSAGARFAGRVGGFWYTPENAVQERAAFDTLRRIVAELHRVQPGMVVQGAIFEIVYAQVNNLRVPNAARAEFGEDTVAVPTRNFRLADMVYPGYFNVKEIDGYRWDSRPPGEAPGIPDMSRTETQLWFYCCARRQLDAGCEAIHFGQVMLMDKRDAGHHGWWSMLQRVRAYARTRNRGFVLCDAHTHSEYYDPDPQRPLPDSARQLLFDFHSYPLRATENDTVRAGTHGARLEIATSDARNAAIFGRSGGGVAPGGWAVRRLPALVELDNWGRCTRPGQPGQWPCIWGYDEISWFATQPSDYRDEWLVYATARVQQLDPNVYLQMPGIRGVEAPPRPVGLYRADIAGQGDIIRAIWAGETAQRGQRLLLYGPSPP